MNLEIDRRYNFHSVSDADRAKIEMVRQGVKFLAKMLEDHCPANNERSNAASKLEEALFWANASIARKS